MVTYRREVDGLRSVAVLMVLIYHARPALLPSGFVGVDVFFVISGFLIGSLLLTELDGRGISILKFYARRLKRVLPALVVVVACTIFVGMLVLTPAELRDLTRSGATASVGLSNVYFWKTANYFADAAEFKPLITTWSLGVEEQFYLIAPILLILIGRWRRNLLVPVVGVLCVASIALSIWMTAKTPSAAYYLLPSRWFELGIGLLTAALWSHPAVVRIRHSPAIGDVFFALGVGVITLSGFLIDEAHGFPGPLALAPTLGTVLVVLSEKSRLSARTLGSAPAVGIGKISYSVYLWHWPLLSFARISAGGPIDDAAALTIGSATFVFAYLSWRFVETPFRRWELPPRRAVGTALATAATLAGCVWAIGVAMPRLFDFPAAAARLDAEAETLRRNVCLVSGSTIAPPPSECLDLTDRSIVLIGDSHAAAIAPALRRLAERRGLGFAQITRSNCPPLLTTRRTVARWPSNARECSAQNRLTFDLVGRDDRIAMVVLTAFWGAPFLNVDRDADGAYEDDAAPAASDPEVLRIGLLHTIRAWRALKRKVVVIGDVPVFRFDPLIRERASVRPLRDWIAARVIGRPSVVGEAPTEETEDGPHRANEVLRTLTAEIPDIPIVDPDAIFCREDGCLFKQSGDLLYIDRHHLSDEGADLLLSRLDDVMPAPIEGLAHVDRPPSTGTRNGARMP